jgi:putative flippase GtrA
MNKLINNFLDIFKQQDIQRFLVMGLLSNMINFCVYYALINFNINLSFSSILGYLSGLVCSYHLGRVWVFGQQFDINSKSILWFGIVYFLGSVWMTGMINLMVNILSIDYKISWIFGVGAAAVNNYLGMKFLIFRKIGR